MRKRKCRLWDFICKKEYLWHPYELVFRPIWKGCYAPKYGTIKQTRLIMGWVFLFALHLVIEVFFDRHNARILFTISSKNNTTKFSSKIEK